MPEDNLQLNRPADSLKDTLPKGTDKIDQLDLLQLALKEGTNSLKGKGLIRNFSTFEKSLGESGINLNKLPGSVSSQIMGFVKNRTANPNDTLDTFSDLVSKIQQKQKEDIMLSRKNLALSVEIPGFMSGQTNEDLNTMSQATGIDYEILDKLRVTDVINKKVEDNYVKAINENDYDINNIKDESMFNRVFARVGSSKIEGEKITGKQALKFIKDNQNASYNELFLGLVEEKGISSGVAKEILINSGRIPPKDAEEDLNANVDDWKENYSKAGKGKLFKFWQEDAGTRLDLVEKLVKMFPGLSKGEVTNMVNRRIGDINWETRNAPKVLK